MNRERPHRDSRESDIQKGSREKTRVPLSCCPPSEVTRELALFTAVEGRVVEEGAGGAVPLSALVVLLV